MSSAASAPEKSRAWLLIEHPGPWPAEAVQAEFGGPLGEAAREADALGIRVQLIRRPGRRDGGGSRRVLAGWTEGSRPWLLEGLIDGPEDPSLAGLSLADLAAGRPVTFGKPAGQPVFLVCAHGRRNVCCARFGGPLAQALAARYPAQVWETTHVGGHRFAANLVLLPHGLYYGPADLATAVAAIGAYQDGTIVASRYRGRAGQPQDAQEAVHTRLAASGSLPL